MLPFLKKASFLPFSIYGKGKLLLIILILFGFNLGFGQAVVEFSQATGSDVENTGGNLPELFVTGTVTNATTVTVSDAGTGDATAGVDYAFTSPQVVNIPSGTYDGTLATSITISMLSITGDLDVEPNETIDLVVGTATGDA
ncbi:MAG: hypothetical protein ABJP76_14195, partial [Flavobacteriaceae bacterium]